MQIIISVNRDRPSDENKLRGHAPLFDFDFGFNACVFLFVKFLILRVGVVYLKKKK